MKMDKQERQNRRCWEEEQAVVPLKLSPDVVSFPEPEAMQVPSWEPICPFLLAKGSV